ncbi:FAD-dependent monooxygenase [Nocardiopsis ansamitocini]|uniref:Oxygenase n=1 Tax=Nocardiopsis ansamitocini TaxID=1670832 RepID=A0A9W6UGW3_9ACTN|nr:FAD-dependent monooxygenase [Nocardiopsis ansamitocini]GLU48166.1 oxygenase [Nocardiopsis ansamitocini]
MQSPVLVIGAGPTGLALACGLRMRGTPVRILDTNSEPAATSRALGVQPRGVEVLNRLGALGDLPERSISLSEVRIYIGHRLVSTMPMRRMAAQERSPLLISQVEVEASLRRRLVELGGRVEWDHELVGVTQDDTGVNALLRTPTGLESVRASWVAGCDGAHSLVRKLAGIGFPGAPVAENFILADVRTGWDADREIMSSWTHGGGMISVCALPGEGRWRLMSPSPPGTSTVVQGEAALEQLRRQLGDCTSFCPDQIDKVEWLSSFRIHRRLADSYRQGRLLLAGDAAAIHHPFGGQGMNTGLGDAENLAWKLALVMAGRADERLIDSYQAERRPIADAVVSATTATSRVVLGDTPGIRVLRDSLILPLMDHPKVQEYLWRSASQLGVHYRGRSLAAKRSRFKAGPRPGERVPDIACRLVDGSHTTVHQALRGRWALLAPPGHEDSIAVATERLGEELVTLYPEHPGLTDVLLVRPDAHLAWRGNADPTGLWGWLDGVLTVGAAPRRA